MALVTLDTKEVANTFQWKPRAEPEIAVKDMVDRHLFYTVRMIWNNFMPDEARVGEVRLYHFGPRYTSEYLADALRAMVPELERREHNLPVDWKRQISQMRAWFMKSFEPAFIPQTQKIESIPS